MNNLPILKNRLVKNLARLKGWIKENHIEAYRLYDRDIPEFPFIIDIYKDEAIMYEKGKKLSADEIVEIAKKPEDIADILIEVLHLKKVHFKIRRNQTPDDQYKKLGGNEEYKVISENGCQFYVNLSDYLDSGLFLDHRPLRKIIKNEAQGKRVLNLFCYTGSISVAAAVGGAHVTSVDLSRKYLNWAQENFYLNNINPDNHTFVASDTFEFLKTAKSDYDIIIVDPPSFSNSKKMDGTFDIQRDHGKLIDISLQKLKAQGKLYFSGNLRSFKLDEALKDKCRQMTKETIPFDYRDEKIHFCYEFKKI
jgi:23S rRNA G2069 N7-methylase RlmK/C1962 C5-methylase RlmI